VVLLPHVLSAKWTFGINMWYTRETRPRVMQERVDAWVKIGLCDVIPRCAITGMSPSNHVRMRDENTSDSDDSIRPVSGSRYSHGHGRGLLLYPWEESPAHASSIHRRSDADEILCTRTLLVCCLAPVITSIASDLHDHAAERHLLWW